MDTTWEVPANGAAPARTYRIRPFRAADDAACKALEQRAMQTGRGGVRGCGGGAWLDWGLKQDKK